MIANFINQNPLPCTDVFRRKGQIVFWDAALHDLAHANQNFPAAKSPFFQCLDSLAKGIEKVEAIIKARRDG